MKPFSFILIFKQKLSLFYHAKHILSTMKGCANYSENYIEKNLAYRLGILVSL